MNMHGMDRLQIGFKRVMFAFQQMLCVLADRSMRLHGTFIHLPMSRGNSVGSLLFRESSARLDHVRGTLLQAGE